MQLPTNIATGRVTGQFVAGVVDGVDVDQDPDAVPAAGFVTFTASVPYLPDPTASPNPVTVLSTSIVAVLDNEGYLCTPVEGTLEPSYRGVRLIATDDPDISVTDWTWNATYSFSTVAGQKLAIPTHSFAVPSGGTVDLTTVVKVPSSTGIGTEQAEALAASAQAAAISSAADAAAAQAAAAAAAAEASANDAGVTTLLTTDGTSTKAAVTALVTSSNSDKLDTDDAVSTYQSQAALDAAVAAKVNTGGTSTKAAVQAIADASAEAAAEPKLDASQKGAASGVASLDSGSKVPVAQLPAATTSTAGTQSAADKTKIDGATAGTSNDTLVKRNSTGVAAFSQVQIDNDPVNSFHGARKAYVDAQDATKVAKGELFKSVRDYRGASDPDDTLAIAAAHSANPVVFYPLGAVQNYTPGAANNLYSGTYTNALGPRWQAGTPTAPTADARPVMWVQKHSSATRTVNPSEWDNGAIYGDLIKSSGSAYGAAVTGYARHASADGGQLIGIHGRAQARVSASEVWGTWSYASSLTGTTFASLIGHEINVNSKTADIGWQEFGVSGQSRGLVVVTADGSEPITHGIYVGNNSAAPAGKMHSLIHLKGDAVVPSDAAISSSSVANNESIRIDGSPTANASTGIRFRGSTGSTRFRTGISFAEATFDNNAAIVLADDHRIVVGAGPGSSAGLAFNKTTGIANFTGFTQIQVNGTKVLGARSTGWGAASGTIDKTAWTTYVAPTVSATYVQAELQGVANRLMSIEQRVAALQQAATTHGQIGA